MCLRLVSQAVASRPESERHPSLKALPTLRRMRLYLQHALFVFLHAAHSQGRPSWVDRVRRLWWRFLEVPPP